MRIAVIGCGSIGIRHLRNLKHLGFENLIAFDILPETRRVVERELRIPVLERIEELWARKPDAVFIASPTNQHIEQAIMAARQGCHLFIEKPLSHSLSQIDILLHEVEKRGLVTMVACNMRFHPGPSTIKKLLGEAAIGQVIAARLQTGSFLPGWRPQQDYRQSYSASLKWGGAILDCIHEIDLSLWYFGPASLLGSVSLAARTINLETDGLAEILLSHDSGVISSVHLNFVQRDYRRSCQVIGSSGTIYWEFSDHLVQVYGPQGDVVQEFSEPVGWELNQMYVDEIDHFFQAVNTVSPTTNPISGGLAAQQIALAVRQKSL